MLRIGLARRARASLVASGILLLALPGPSLAAPTWLAPVALSDNASQGVLQPQIATDPAGNAVAVWDIDGSIRSAARPVGGPWGPPELVVAPGQQARSPDVGMDAFGAATAVWERWNGTNWVISAKTRPAGGAWSPFARQLSTAARNATQPRLAVNEAGAAVLAWLLEEGSGTHTVQALTRPAGGSFELTPSPLSDTGEDGRTPEVAIGEGGAACVVWGRVDGTVEVVRSANRPVGASWSAAENLTDPQQNNAGHPHIAVDAAGTAIAVWEGVFVTPFMSTRIQTATRAAGGAWSAPELISDSGATDTQVAVDRAGNAFAVWARHLGPAARVEAVRRPVGGGWSSPADLSSAEFDVINPDVAAAAGSATAVAVWESADNFSIIRAAVWTAGGDWSSGQDLASGQSASPEVSMDAAGNGVAVWLGQAGVHAAGLDAAGPVLADVSIPAAGASVSHAYSAPGTYTVTVSQADAVGNLSSTTRDVSIQGAPQQPPESLQQSPPSSPPASPPASDPPESSRPIAQPRCVVPKIVGKKLAKARAAIKKRNCRTGKVQRKYSKKRRKGFVLTQRPKVGTNLANGAKVNLVVSRGPKPRRR